MQTIEWKTEKRKVRDLVPYASNPRKMTRNQFRHLVESFEKFNYVELVAIQPDNRIIAGHMRIKVLRQMGRGNEEIEVRVPTRILSEQEMREYLIRSNKNKGDFDYDILANEYDPNDLLAFGFEPEDLSINVIKDEEEGPLGEEEICTSCGQKIRKKRKKNDLSA